MIAVALEEDQKTCFLVASMIYWNMLKVRT